MRYGWVKKWRLPRTDAAFSHASRASRLALQLLESMDMLQTPVVSRHEI